MEEKRLVQHGMQFRVVVAPSCEQGPDLSFGGLVFVTALYVGLDLSSEIACRIAFRTDSVEKSGQLRAKVTRTLYAVHARIVLDRFHHVGQRAEGGDVLRSSHAVKHLKPAGAVREAQPVEAPTQRFEASVHRVHIPGFLRRPKAL